MQIQEKLFIGGEWVDPDGASTIDVICPATEEPLGRVPHASKVDVDRAVAAAREAFDSGPWPRTSPGERAEVMARVSKVLQGRRDEVVEPAMVERYACDRDHVTLVWLDDGHQLTASLEQVWRETARFLGVSSSPG